MVRDLSDPIQVLRRQQDNTRRLNSRTRAQNTAVDRGAFRIKSPEGLEVGTVDDASGSAVVYGTLTVVGTLNGDGSITWAGPWNLTGPGSISGDTTGAGELTWAGPWHLNGPGTIAGDVTQTGNTNQQGNVTVNNGGKITVTGADGDTVIQNSRVTFANGAELVSETDSLVVRQGTSGVVAGSGQAQLRSGGKFFRVSSTGGFRAAGLPTIARADANNAVVGTIWANTAGDLYRVI